ncbi:hypothetical protein HRG_010569 [Hirsutella rhossiliensis]|uniref:Uncharacterized protein n=1 Tax=Hirsutella rhossiliensis TaxID=111463 RepID=A0A9P8MMU4_9HYPO|nr:uncharacterized protein HRG_10569 [Hirsutella rhossiliensis]KAH0958268.1 hypothetical protein HRG_10569 [Hirsutella rhossiliensis]
MADLDMPIALRRPRRSVGPTSQAEETAALPPSRHPRTPRRLRKAVRFSDPGPSPSTGLTPSIRRTCLGTPRGRRASTPSRCRPSPHAAVAARLEAPAAPACLRQTADGRVERRIRRSNLRDLLNRLEQQKKRSAKVAQAEIGALQAEIKMRDRDIYELQNATVVIDTDRIWDLEQQVEELRDELQRRSDVPATPRSDSQAGRTCYDWTLAARDPFVDDDDDDVTDVAPDEDHFGDATMAQLAASTPSRARSSFPTPPATSPALPATPCWRAPLAVPGPSHAGVQACFPDPAKEQLEEELASLRLEVRKLAATLESYQSLGERVADRLSSVTLSAVGAASGVHGLEQQVEGLVQAMSDRTAALALLTSSIADIGFPGSDAGDMVVALAAGFRAARLELEYLTPGEVVLPLSSHGAEVLDLLLSRLRVLAKKVQEDEATIDEYHEIEQSLRKQLDARVSVIEGLKLEMSTAEHLFNEKHAKIQELQVGNQRLSGAVDGYVRDIAELEKLVERMEQEGQEIKGAHQARQQSDRETLGVKEASIAELEGKLASAMRRTTSLQLEISNVQDSSTRHVVTLNKEHGAALALRDARVLELRGEIDRLNESLRAAHDIIRELRVGKGDMEAQMRGDKQKAKAAMDAVKSELQRVLQMSQFLDEAPEGEAPGAESGSTKTADNACSSVGGPRTVVRPGGFLAAAPVRRGSQKMARRHDSGMGLLHEDEVDI